MPRAPFDRKIVPYLNVVENRKSRQADEPEDLGRDPTTEFEVVIDRSEDIEWAERTGSERLQYS